MSATDEWAETEGNPMFDRMTDGEIAHYFEDLGREPAEPDWDAIEYARHCETVHGGGDCDCPPPPVTGPAFTDEEEPPFLRLGKGLDRMTDFDLLADGLRTWAAGDWIPAAAVELLIEDGTWLRRDDFPAACIGQEEDIAWIDWDAARAFSAAVTECSNAEAVFLRLAVAIGSDEYRLASVDEEKRVAIVRAVASAARMEGLLRG